MTSGTIVAVRDDCGIIERCPECRRVLRESSCSEHGAQRGQEDLRLRFVIDDGVSNASLLVSREPAEAFLSMGMDEVKQEISKIGRGGFVSSLTNRVLSRKMTVQGLSLIHI